jgi:hypothetical protein
LYRARIAQITSLDVTYHAITLWVGLPIMAPTQYRAGAKLLNSQYERVVTATSGGAYLTSWNLFATKTGEFEASARVNGVDQSLRSQDGIHFTYVGEQVFATYVARVLGSGLSVKVQLDNPEVIQQ